MRKPGLSLLFSLCAGAAMFAIPMTVCGQASLADVPKKKYIELGWDIPNTAYLRANHEEMQRTTPFDGVMLDLDATDADGKKVSSQSMLDPQPWDPAWFAPAVADLKACRWTTFTDNFIRVNFSPGRVRWDDDAGWKAFCGKSALCAKIAKETGLKGVAIDFEPYGDRIFQYQTKYGKPFAEMQRDVRQRGRQWMKAMADEYPDMVLFTLFILNVVPKPSEYQDADTLLEPAGYGLLPAFLNGMLDVLPPGMKVVDGCESGYYHNGMNEYARWSLEVQAVGGGAMRLVAPENRQKYAAQVQVGFGFYLDMYTNPEGSVYYRGSKPGGTRLDRMMDNLAAATATADEYVWLYGEQRRWWKPEDAEKEWEHWETALPGMTRTIEIVKSPRDAARKMFARMKESGKWENLLKNGNFSDAWSNGEYNFPENWDIWRKTAEKGVAEWEEDEDGRCTARLSDMPEGCLLQAVPVTPGRFYYFSLDMKQEGAGRANMRICWQTADGKRGLDDDNILLAFPESPAFTHPRPMAEGWRRTSGLVRVPDAARFLVFQAEAHGQESEKDVIWFDNAVLLAVE